MPPPSTKPIDIRLLREYLVGCGMISSLEYVRSTDSTNDWAMRLLGSGQASHGVLFLTDEQTSGKGRFARRWFSPKFSNMYASLIVRNQWSMDDILYMTIVASLAVRTALERICGIQSRIKWPNDILVERKKISGILIENTAGYFIVGIGLNINSDPSQHREIMETATSISSITGREFERERVIAGLFLAFQEHYDQFSKDKSLLFTAWKNALVVPEGKVELVSGGKRYYGRVTGFSRTGSLEFETDNGEMIPFDSVESY